MYKILKRRIAGPRLVVLVVINIALIYILKRNVVPMEPYFIKWTLTDTISCHLVTEGDVLPSAQDMVPLPDSIFFHETTCRGGLNSRQACAVEAVARIHPERTVYVLFNSPISRDVLERSCIARLMEFGNVQLARVHTAEYAKDTVLADMLAHGTGLNESLHKIEHTADLLRFITMYKYGGVYLDTDMLVVKRLDPLGKNWIAKEKHNFVSIGALAVGREEFGRNLMRKVLEEINSTYRPDLWAHNGPGAVNRVLKKVCNVFRISDLSAATCKGFEIYDPELIYPIHWSSKDSFFVPDTDFPPEKVEKAYSFHLWNKLTHNTKVGKNSPYDKLAMKYCPSIKNMYGDRFGS